MKILFVRGFNTDLNSKNKHSSAKYENFDKNIEHKIVFFNYGPNEHIKDVFDRLSSDLNSNTYDLILAHSMGGCLLTKYLQLNPFFYERTHTKIILIAPLLVPRKSHKKMFKWSFMKYLHLPNQIVSNKSKKDDYTWVNLKQIHQIYKKKYGFFLEESTLVQTLNNYPLLYIIYSKEENKTPVPSSILEKLNRVTYVDGCHSAFQRNEHSNAFFDTLLKTIDKKET
jgi:predicted alpha/beta hydrolase family esterase